MKKYRINIIIIVIVTFLVLYFSLKDNFNEIIANMSHINLLWILIAIAFMFGSWFFAAMNLYTLSRSTDKNFSLRSFYGSVIISNFFNAITPSDSGGQPFQIYILNRRGMRVSTATHLVIESFKLYQIALVIWGLIAITLNNFLHYYATDSIVRKLVILGFIVNLTIAVFLILFGVNKKVTSNILKFIFNFLHKVKIIKNKEKMFDGIDNYIESSIASSEYFKGHRWVLFKSGIYSFISIGLLYTVPIFIVYSFGNFESLSILSVIVSTAYVMLIGAFVPIPGGSGGVEFAFAHFYGFFITGPVLMSILLIWRLVTYYFGILMGGIMFIFNKERRN